MKVNRLSAENTNALNYENARRGNRGMKKLRRETTRENKVQEGGNEAGEQDEAWEDIFALSSRARSYYRHTWCNILPLIFASVRGFLLWPRHDFTSTHAVRDATGGSLPRRVESGGRGTEDDRMLLKFAKSRGEWYIPSSPPLNPAPFRFRSRTSSRSREKFRAKVGGCPTRANAQLALVGPPFSSPRATTWPPPDIVHPCLAIIASVHRHSVAFFPRLDRSSLTASPSHRRLVSRTTVTERALT